MAQNKISVLIDVAADKATRSVKGLRDEMSKAQGLTGKLKAGSSSVGRTMQANLAPAAMAAAGALVVFGKKSVDAFTSTAIEAGKMSDALGMPVEDISRLNEVAGDLGIEASTLEGVISKMNVTAGKTPEKFEAIGASIVKNKDGTTDVTATFLSAVEAINKIPDAAERAKAAQEIFGRGWKSAAELIGQGSEQIKTAMGEVSDAKVIDEEEVQKARRLREAMDNLSDVLEDVQLMVGEHLAPAVADLAERLVWLNEQAEKLKLIDLANAFREWTDPINAITRGIDVASQKTDLWGRTIHKVTAEQMEFVKAAKDAGIAGEDVADATDRGVSSFEQYIVGERYAAAGAKELADKTAGAEGAIDDLAGAADDAARKINLLDDEYATLKGRLSDEAAFLSAQEQIRALGADTDLTRQEIIDAQLAVLNYVEQLGGIPADKATAITALIDQGKYNEAAAALDMLARQRTIWYTVAVNNASPTALPDAPPGFHKAAGGPVRAGDLHMVGEKGPELFVAGQNGSIIPNHKLGNLAGGGGSGATFVINIGVGGPDTGKQVVRAIQEFEKRNGNRWRR